MKINKMFVSAAISLLILAGCSEQPPAIESRDVAPNATASETNRNEIHDDLYPFRVTTDGQGNFSFEDTSCGYKSYMRFNSCEDAVSEIRYFKKGLEQFKDRNQEGWKPYTCK